MTLKNNPDITPTSLSLGEAATQYLTSLSSTNKLKTQQEVNRFVRWYGEKRMIHELTIPEVSDYADHLSPTITDTSEKVEPVKSFLNYAYKNGLTKTKLSVHLKIKRGQGKPISSTKQESQNVITLTPEGYAELESELISLKNERPRITEEIRKAAADKDFRENAPLDAAKNYQGHVEARIKELESTLKIATIMAEKQAASPSIAIGNTILLRDLQTNETLEYTLVDAREANPSKGKLSTASPIGKSLLGRNKDAEISVIAPAGVHQYKIVAIKQ
jgi:transcription elongation factor GreA